MMPILLTHKRTLSDSHRENSSMSKQHKKTMSMINEKLFPEGFFKSGSKKKKAISDLETESEILNFDDKIAANNTSRYHNMLTIRNSKRTNDNSEHKNGKGFKISLFLKHKKADVNLEPKFKISDFDIKKPGLETLEVKKKRILSPGWFLHKQKEPEDLSKIHRALKVNLQVFKEKIERKVQINNTAIKSRPMSLKTPSKPLGNTTIYNEESVKPKASNKKNPPIKLALPQGSALKKLCILTQQMNKRPQPSQQPNKDKLNTDEITKNLKRHMRTLDHNKNTTYLNNPNEISLNDNFSFRPLCNNEKKSVKLKPSILNDYSKLSNGGDTSYVNCFKSRRTNKPIIPLVFRNGT